MVNELAAVVGMEPQNPKGELLQNASQHWYQPRFGDLSSRSHHLPLSNFIHRVDIVNAFDSVEVTLMNGVYPQIPRPSLRLRFAPLSNRYFRRPGFLDIDPPLPVKSVLAQVV